MPHTDESNTSPSSHPSTTSTAHTSGTSDSGRESDAENGAFPIKHEHHGYLTDDIDEAITEIRNESFNGENNDVDGRGTDTADKTDERLQRSAVKLQKQERVTKMVGQRGKPNQVVQDAYLARDINQSIIPAIQRIKISNSIWQQEGPDKFTELLLAQLAHHYVDPNQFDDPEEEIPKLDMDADGFCSAFIDEYLHCCVGGCVPDIAPVFASLPSGPKGGIAPIKNKKKRITQLKELSVAGPSSSMVIQNWSKLPVAQAGGGGGAGGAKFSQIPFKGIRGHFAPAMSSFLRAAAASGPGSAGPASTGSLLPDDLYERILKECHRRNKRPVSLLPILIDTDSFQLSVANFFTFSLLLQDKRVSMTIDPKIGLAFCRPLRSNRTREDTPDLFDDEDQIMEGGQSKGSDLGQTVVLQLRESDWAEIADILRRRKGTGGGSPKSPMPMSLEV